MNLHLQAGRADEMVRRIADHYSIGIEDDCNRSMILVPERAGKGEIIAYNIDDGLDLLILHTEVAHNWRFSFQNENFAPLMFYTLAQGVFQFQQDQLQSSTFDLSPLQSTIHNSVSPSQYYWHIPKQDQLSLAVIMLHKEPFFTEVDCGTLEIPADLLKIVEDIQGKAHFLFQDIYHLPIIKAFQDIIQQEDKGLLNSTFASAKTYEMLFFQLQEFLRLKKAKKQLTIKSASILKAIQDAHDILTSRLQDPPTIVELARMVGINQQSLKLGFKQLYGLTINQCLNEKRLEQAALLIKGGEMSMQEIALEIGYNDSSYFSRRFKSKFGVAPKYYAQQVA